MFAGPMQDSTPAIDHYSNLRSAVTAMLVQEINSGLFSFHSLKTATDRPRSHARLQHYSYPSTRRRTTRQPMVELRPTTVCCRTAAMGFRYQATRLRTCDHSKPRVSTILSPDSISHRCRDRVMSLLGCLGASPLLGSVKQAVGEGRRVPDWWWGASRVCVGV